MLKKEDLIDGQVYIYNHREVIKYSLSNEGYPTLDTLSKRFFYYPWSLGINVFERVTDETKEQIEACIKANKFIPLEEINKMINNYEIY